MTCVVAVCAVLALVAASLVSCAEAESPVSHVEERARGIGPATLPAAAQLIDMTPVRKLSHGYEVTWRLTASLSWDEYARSVRTALAARMSVRLEAEGLLSLQQNTDADIYRIEVRSVSAEDGHLIVHVRCRAEAW